MFKPFVSSNPSRPPSDQFKAHFAEYGTVTDANIMMDHSSGRSRGFGCVCQSWGEWGNTFQARLGSTPPLGFTPPLASSYLRLPVHTTPYTTAGLKTRLPSHVLPFSPLTSSPLTSSPSPLLRPPLSRPPLLPSHVLPFSPLTSSPLTSSPSPLSLRFVTFEEEDSVQDILKAGPMHTLQGKQVSEGRMHFDKVSQV